MHSGMMSSAACLLNTDKRLAEVNEKWSWVYHELTEGRYKDWDLVVVGHSLGAGKG